MTHSPACADTGEYGRGDAILWREYALYAAVVLSAVLYSFRLTSFLHAKEAALHIGLIACALCAILQPPAGRGNASWLLPLLAGLLWALASGILRAQVPAHVIEESIRFAALLALLALNADLFNTAPRRNRIETALIAAAVLTAALGVMQYCHLIPALFPVFPGYDQRVYSVFGNQDLFGGYLAIAIPLLAARIAADPRMRPAAYAALALLMAGLVLSGARSAWLAAAAGVLVGMPWRRVPARKLVRMLAFLALAVACVAAATWPRTAARVTNTLAVDDVGGRARLWFWDGAARMIRDHAIAGVGLGNYGYWSPWYQGEALRAPNGDRHYHNELHTDHAHSEALEFLAETGLPGMVCGLFFLLRLLRFRGRAWGGLTALLVFSCFNAAFRSAPHALAGLLLAGMLTAQPAAAQLPPARSVRRAWLYLALSLLLAGGFAWTVHTPSRLLRAAEDAHIAGQDPSARYARAIAHPWPNALAHEEFGMALLDAARYEEAYAQLLKAREGLDTGRVYLLLGTAAMHLGDTGAAQMWLGACLDRWPANAAAWRMLWPIAPEHLRASLRAHAQRWNIPDAALTE